MTDEQAKWVEECERARNVKVGDMLNVQDDFNYKSNPDKLPKPVEVLAIDTTQRSQTDVMLKVRALRGHTLWLDAAWFVEVKGE